MSDLDTRLARGPLSVRSVWSGGSPERLAQRILRRRRIMFALDVAVVCACLAFVPYLYFKEWGTQPAIPTLSAQVPSVTSTRLADGSVAELSSADARIQIEQDTPTRVVTRVSGGARFLVVPNPQRTFEVQARDVRVRVLGTVFSVQELPSGQTQVLVERGRVEVAWLGGAKTLLSGQGGSFPPASEIDQADAAAEHDAPSAAAVEPQENASDLPELADAKTLVRRPNMRGAAPPANRALHSWRDYAKSGDYKKAYDELHAKEGPRGDAVRDDVGDLMLAADVARLSGHPNQSVKPLRDVCDRHAGDKRAPVAAFTLGRVLLDQLGRPSEAASVFQMARRLWPSGPLAEDALARETDAWERAGRADRARVLASEYLRVYPQGRHGPIMRKRLGL